MPQTDPTYAPAELTPATWGRRILALFVDWVTCLAVVEGLVAVGVLAGNPNGLGTLALFVLESALFTAVTGASFGKLATRIRVVRTEGSEQPVSLLRALVRTVLVALLIPPLLTFDGRGLHDVAAGTRTVTI
ncbi:RDD family protein [Nocardioides astragali]|uniref:RDD family protein n=1 Tax=Nocardioides astragali TaxID=1776736 RepID=A0ABW2MYN8_9ACTN|nr:RDD family protein [Nocardioides astragali]